MLSDFSAADDADEKSNTHINSHLTSALDGHRKEEIYIHLSSFSCSLLHGRRSIVASGPKMDPKNEIPSQKDLPKTVIINKMQLHASNKQEALTHEEVNGCGWTPTGRSIVINSYI